MKLLSRRRLLTTSPAKLAAWLAQWPYGEPTPMPGADTTLNLTWRLTSIEVQMRVVLSILREHGDMLRWLGEQVLQPGQPWPVRPRRT